MDTDYHDPAMLITCYDSLGDTDATRRAAQLTLGRVEKALAQDPGNGFALGQGGLSHAVLGDKERAKEWLQRAMLIDPDNWSMVYNVACVYTTRLGFFDDALTLLERLMATASATQLAHCQADPDLNPLRDHPRFKVLIAAATARLSGSTVAA
jgi:adenylate cyclase